MLVKTFLLSSLFIAATAFAIPISAVIEINDAPVPRRMFKRLLGDVEAPVPGSMLKRGSDEIEIPVPDSMLKRLEEDVENSVPDSILKRSLDEPDA